MKFKPKKYASALFELLAADEKKTDAIIEKFVQVLAQNSDRRLWPQIIEKFSDICDKNNGRQEAQATTASKITPGSLKFLTQFIAQKCGVKNVAIKNEIDQKILGGVILRWNDKIPDASLKTKIEQLKNKMQTC